MKKYFLVILVFFFFQKINATHNVGGEITLNQIAYKQYEANLTTYTEASSLPADRDSLFLCWGDGLCEWIVRDTSFLIDCGYKQNIYKKNHTYNTEGTYIVSMTDPNRNGDIINLNPIFSDNIPFHIQTKHTVSSAWNQTPIFLNIPTDIGITSSVYQHNSAAIDWDGDSLSYSLIVPMQDVNLDVPNHSFPNEIGASTTNNFSIDTERGTITWDAPAIPGSYNVAVLVKEYRAGNILSETIRDFLIEVQDNPNPNIISPPVTSIPFDEVTLSVGDEFNFEVLSDELNGANIKVQAFGLPFLILDTAEFLPTPIYSPPVITGNFSWTITDAHVLLEPYYVVFRTEKESDQNDCGYTSYQVLKININDSPTNLSNLEKFDFKIYPNPVVNQQLNIELPTELTSKQCSYKIINSDGKVVATGNLDEVNASQTIDIQPISKGSYFIILRSENKIGVKNFIK